MSGDLLTEQDLAELQQLEDLPALKAWLARKDHERKQRSEPALTANDLAAAADVRRDAAADARWRT